MSYAEYLKKATALKRQGDMAGAIEAIDQALDLCSPGDSGAPQALKKKIAYLIAADRKQEALVSAEVLVGRAEEGAMGMEQLVGVRVRHGEHLGAQFIIGKCELWTKVLRYTSGAMGDVDHQGNLDATRRCQDFVIPTRVRQSTS